MCNLTVSVIFIKSLQKQVLEFEFIKVRPIWIFAETVKFHHVARNYDKKLQLEHHWLKIVLLFPECHFLKKTLY